MGATAETRNGRLLGSRYRLGQKLGHGAMGVVYEAVQESLGRAVAIKVLNPALAGDDGLVARFRAEAERAGKMSHPHIVQVLDFGSEPDGEVWIAMERLLGEPLSARIDRGGMSEHEVVSVAREVLSALAAAHGQRLVHRDLKPDNIYLARVEGVGDTVKVLDFGIAKLLDGAGAAKLTATGVLVGTPLYMAPEQAKGADVDERADLYALGAVMYEALVGQPPFPATNYNALLYAVLTQDPAPLSHVRPGITPGLVDVIARAMAKDPANRFQSAREMSAALDTLVLAGSPAPARQSIGTADTLNTPLPGGAVAVSPADSLAKTALESGVKRATTQSAAPSPRRGMWLAGGGLLAGIVVTVAVVGAYAAGIEDATDDDEEEPAVVLPVPSDPLGPMAPTEEDVVAASVPAAQPEVTGGLRRPAEDPGVDTGAPLAHGGRRGGGGAGAGAGAGPVERDGTRTGGGPGFGILERVEERRNARDARRGNARAAVRASFIAAPDMPRGEVIRAINDAHSWSACWPRSVPVPVMNRSRCYDLSVAADGRVTSATKRGTDDGPAELHECILPKLQQLTLPAPTTGAATDFYVCFGFDPI